MARTAKDAEQLAMTPVVYPIYLDVPMMVSFLAALRDGVEFENTVTRRDQRSANREREASGKVRLPPLASLFGLEASGRMAGQAGEETSEEVKVVRQHTAASLFNSLLAALRADGLLKTIGSAADLTTVRPSDIVEISGEFIGNPLEPVLAFFRQAAPYFEIVRDPSELPGVDLSALRLEVTGLEARARELDERTRKSERSGNPAVKKRAETLREEASAAQQQATLGAELLKSAAAREEQEGAMKMLTQMSDDLAETPVRDTVIEAGDLKAVLTMSAEYFTDATRAHLRAGVFRAVGKVTRVLDEDDDINLLRRTVLGAAQPEVGRDLLRSAVDDESLRVETYDPIITAPAVQILPLAVFV
ncbi:MAG: hypothetical protein QOE11_2904 [Solirubrobacteraceae bacterium]|jgi:hypothetical protein|nr:hypothetical protein [Solirubrobacteraceae bacterium]